MFTSVLDATAVFTVLLVVGMALSLGDVNAVFRKARGDSRNVGTAEALRSLSQHINALGNPDLQLVQFSGLETADKVIGDVGCKLFALYARKPTGSTTDAWLKGSNHASAAAANGDIVIYFRGTSGGGRAYCVVFHDGLPLATGLTLGSHTAVNGAVKSAAADAPAGFAIIGAL